MTLAFVENESIIQHPVGTNDVRRKFPNVSFPRDLEGGDFSAFGVVTVQNIDPPTFDSATQKVLEGDPALVDGVWQQTWNIIDLTAEELQQIADGKASQVRSIRNGLLADSDWTQAADCELSDALKAEWVAYRQALRRVPEQAGFPHEVNWPTEPVS